MNIYAIIIIWSLIGVIPYQIFYLLPWSKERPHKMYVPDVYKAIPFGVITTCSALIVYVLSKNIPNQKGKL